MHVADIWEAVADAAGDAPAVVQGERTVSWRQYEDRSSRLAACFAAAGLGHGSKVGMFLYNCPEYLEVQFAAFKERITPVNVNYRYLDDELHYLLDNADCEAVVFHSSLGERIARVKDRLPKLRLLIEVTDTEAPRSVPGAEAYEDVIAGHQPAARRQRGHDDVYMLYTGGTTGMPKGVMYSTGDFADAFLAFAATGVGRAPFASVEEVAATVSAMVGGGMQQASVPCCPLMHGTGIWLGAMLPHMLGGRVVLLESRSFDADELWRVVERNGVNTLVIVGDAFARTMLSALQAKAATGTPYDTSSMFAVISSGAMFSSAVKEGIHEHIPQLVIMDVLGSTEGGMAQNISTKGTVGTTATFGLTPGAKVFGPDDTEVEPGSGVIGMVGVTGPNVPLGYYKDPEKSARTFRQIDGVRYSFPGDMALVEADGTITLLGRGSNCINTGGEKVFPEEVEEAVKTHEAIADCLVFGIDDEKFGQRVVGVASLADGAAAPSPEDVIAHTKRRLSAFKAPKQLVFVDQVPRAPNGKADYRSARALFQPVGA